MDLAKVLLNRFFGLIANLVPGCCVLLVVALQHGELWRQFWSPNYLGYQTKIAILVFAAFVAGFTVSTLAGALIGGIIGGITGYKGARLAAQAAASSPGPHEQAQTQAQAPATQAGASSPGPREQAQAPAGQVRGEPYWRDANWRRLLTAYLGDAAPENLVPINDRAEYDRLMTDADSLPDVWRQQAVAQIQARIFNENLWTDWWSRLYLLTLQRNDPRTSTALALVSNFGGACLVILLSAPWTPILRQWWIIWPSLFWVLINAAQMFKQFSDASNPAQSYLKQMEYLQMRVGKGEHADGDTQDS
jgi:hypothetical protein